MMLWWCWKIFFADRQIVLRLCVWVPGAGMLVLRAVVSPDRRKKDDVVRHETNAARKDRVRTHTYFTYCVRIEAICRQQLNTINSK